MLEQACLPGMGGGAPRNSFAAGLSKPHTNTKAIPAPAKVTFYKGAALVDIQGPPSQAVAADAGGGIRGEIAGMSGASRLRFKERLAKVRSAEMANALTVCLTYPRNVVKPEEWEVYKYHLRVFNQAVKCKYSGASSVWVLEFHKSGAPHFHLLVFGVRTIEIEALRQWMQEKWYHIAHNGDKHLGKAGTCIEWAKHGGGVMGYMAKYMSKHKQQNRVGHTGRMWGKFGALPFGEAETPPSLGTANRKDSPLGTQKK